jgi:hypothetical protein
LLWFIKFIIHIISNWKKFSSLQHQTTRDEFQYKALTTQMFQYLLNTLSKTIFLWTSHIKLHSKKVNSLWIRIWSWIKHFELIWIVLLCLIFLRNFQNPKRIFGKNESGTQCKICFCRYTYTQKEFSTLKCKSIDCFCFCFVLFCIILEKLWNRKCKIIAKD